MGDIPDIEWYARRSRELGLATRCPFATVEACPRYYQSLSLLGEAGGTNIDPGEDDRLLRRWKKSDLWPKVREHETSVEGSEGAPSIFSNFCPEVSFDKFGYFATHLARHADEIDKDGSHEYLASVSAPPNDPRWLWAGITSQHYIECPVYSVLERLAGAGGDQQAQGKVPWWKTYASQIAIGIIVALISGLILRVLV